jgi:hypothetical protein
VFEKKVLSIFGPKKRMKRQEFGENCIARRFVICTFRQVNLNYENDEDKMGGAFITNGGRGGTRITC